MTGSSQFYLAVHTMLMIAGFPERHITSTTVAQSAGCHPVIIRNLFIKLRTAGLLHTKCGRGKTELTRPPEEITLLDIFDAVEGDNARETFKIYESPRSQCPLSANVRTVVGEHFSRTTAIMQETLCAVTLASLIAELKAGLTAGDGEYGE